MINPACFVAAEERIKCWLVALSSIPLPQMCPGQEEAHGVYKATLTILCNTPASVFKVPVLRSPNQVQKVGKKYLLVEQSRRDKDEYIKEEKTFRIFSTQR